MQLLINKSFQFIDSEHSSDQHSFCKILDLIGLCNERTMASKSITKNSTEYISKLFKHLMHNIEIHLFCCLEIFIILVPFIESACVIKGECFCNLFRLDWIDIFILDVLYF